MQKQPQRVVVGTKEEELVKKAEAMRSMGFGDPNQKINIEEEMNLHLQNAIADPSDPMARPENAPKPPAEQPKQPEQQGEPFLKLDTDPKKRLEQVHEQLKKATPYAPSIQELVSWKQIHGDIFLLWLDDNIIFIYRYLKNQEWKQLLAGTSAENMTNDQFNEKLFDKCVLWPTVDPIAKAGFPAGLIPTVVEQIRIRSCFLDPAQVINFTIKI